MSRIYGETRQLGIVVHDIDEGIRTLTETMGIGPFFILREVRPENFRYRGKPSPAPLMSLAFAFSGPLQVEVIQQHDDAPSAYKEFLDKGGSGAQHVSSWAHTTEEFDAMCAKAVAAGAVAVHEGQLGPGRFAYYDTTGGPIGLCFEIAEGMIPAYHELQKSIADAAVDWDGQTPIRNIG